MTPNPSADHGAKGAEAAAGPVPGVIMEIDDLQIKRGEFVAVVGSVGSYKSSLLSALLGDMPRYPATQGATHGRVDVHGSIAFVSQQSWICNMTLRDNILFDSPYDGHHYRKVKRACQLEADIEALDGGDMCEIGERGITLSGGQKARVALARACYANNDVVVADDPLAAVRLRWLLVLWWWVPNTCGCVFGCLWVSVGVCGGYDCVAVWLCGCVVPWLCVHAGGCSCG